ncbi:MAG TPA: beta-ketoacyl-ACP synthase III [Burkholderiales bacterium]|nr:beta-ketoacyl-ACP synthase III [Burkholderiales bacterium]
MKPAVYITRSAAALPNAPVENDAVEAILGQVGERPSRARRVVQRNNGIRRRYYAVDPATGEPSHSNARLTAQAIRGLAGNGFALEDIACLACGTSNADQLLPNHAVMVHGELGSPACEVVATAGVCLSGTTALKYGWMSVLSGCSRNAVVTGSEVASKVLRAKNYDQAELTFEEDFLRWMLSDGAGALLLEPAPRRGLNLRIEWLELLSYANQLPTCMSMGADQRLRQDVRLLNEAVVDYTLVKPLQRVVAKRSLSADKVDWFLPHMSSEYFRRPVADGLARAGLPVPQERWFTNLVSVGNIGAAAIYLMLDELLRSGRIRAGQRLLCFVPESGRFSSGFMYLTAHAHA